MKIMKKRAKEIYIVKANGDREIFDRKKLENSLRRTGASSLSVKNVLETIDEELVDGMTTGEIYRLAFQILKNIEGVSLAAKYSIRRAVMELGPEGFPFENFLGAMFKALGYKVQLRQQIKGICVTHEIDVVAENEEELIVSEAKFHNRLGLKCDLKVILYVKERCDDLQQGEFWKKAPQTKKSFWLITNTKFTMKALRYAECCAGLTLVGWNYPEGNSLHDIITKANLYPLTCLETLGQHEKKLLLKENIVLCRELQQGGQRLLDLVGISAEAGKNILTEIDELLLKNK